MRGLREEPEGGHRCGHNERQAPFYAGDRRQAVGHGGGERDHSNEERAAGVGEGESMSLIIEAATASVAQEGKRIATFAI